MGKHQASRVPSLGVRGNIRETKKSDAKSDAKRDANSDAWRASSNQDAACQRANAQGLAVIHLAWFAYRSDVTRRGFAGN